MSMDSSNGKASGLAQNLLGNIEKKLANIRAMKEEQEARVRDAGNPFLKVGDKKRSSYVLITHILFLTFSLSATFPEGSR